MIDITFLVDATIVVIVLAILSYIASTLGGIKKEIAEISHYIRSQAPRQGSDEEGGENSEGGGPEN